MFKRIQAWWQNQKQWHQNWSKNWAGYIEPSEDGLSRLQRMVLDVLAEFGEIPLERVSYDGMIGLEGYLPGTNRRLCVYNDTVTLTKGRDSKRYNLWEYGGYLTPDEFISSFKRDFHKCLSA
jgi:hypothetical protein